MNKLCVAIFAAAFVFGAAPVLGDDGPSNPVGETDATSPKASQSNAPRSLPSKANKQKAIDAATRASEPPPGGRELVGDFPPYYGKSVKQWQEEKKRRTEREYERLEKLTPKQQDEESTERKRRQQEWQRMRPQEAGPTK